MRSLDLVLCREIGVERLARTLVGGGDAFLKLIERGVLIAPPPFSLQHSVGGCGRLPPASRRVGRRSDGASSGLLVCRGRGVCGALVIRADGLATGKQSETKKGRAPHGDDRKELERPEASIAHSLAGASRFCAAWHGDTLEDTPFQSSDAFLSAANRHCYLPPALPLVPGLSTKTFSPSMSESGGSWMTLSLSFTSLIICTVAPSSTPITTGTK